MLPPMTVELHIPDTLPGCHTLIGELAHTIAEQQQKIVLLQQQIETQQLEMDELIRRAFQKRPAEREFVLTGEDLRPRH